MVSYIFYSVSSLGLAYMLYWFLLRNEKTFGFNRLFLLISLVLCLLAPILEFESEMVMSKITKVALLDKGPLNMQDDLMDVHQISPVQASTVFSIYDGIIALYSFITLMFLFRFFKNIQHIYKLTRLNYIVNNEFKIIITDDNQMPCSFFNYLFVSQKDFDNTDYKNTYLKHESLHSKQYHSLDVLYVELIICFFWFNPFVWLYKKVIIQNHEYLADNHVVHSGFDLESYCDKIISTGTTYQRSNLTSAFNFIQTKKRLIMLQKSKSSSFKRFGKIVLATGVFAIIFSISSCTYTNTEGEPLVVVIDAGHGGHDPGNFGEKGVTLKISNMLANYSNERIKIIPTRSSDAFVSIADRIEFIKSQEPDLVISLHSNSYQKDSSTNGIEAYYYDENDFSVKSFNYGEILIENQSDKFANRGVKTADFIIIKNINCPGVVLELGFLTNEKDKAMLTNHVHQQEIAKSLYESLKQISLAN